MVIQKSLYTIRNIYLLKQRLIWSDCISVKNWYIDKIIIDSHENQRGRNAYNQFIEKYNVDVKSLDYGDYMFHTSNHEQVVFEYKTCKDFINSMENKTLFNEVSNQSMHYEYSYLIVEGDFNAIFDELYFGVEYYRYKYKQLHLMKHYLTKQINGAMRRIYAIYVPIIFVDSEEEAFEEMLNISLKIADVKSYGGSVRPSRKKLLQNPSALFLTSVKGIGGVKAENIINELEINSLKDLCEKNPSDFLSVSKITKKNVNEIWEKIHNEPNILE